MIYSIWHWIVLAIILIAPLLAGTWVIRKLWHKPKAS